MPKPVKIRNNRIDYVGKRRKKKALIISLIVLGLAVLTAIGIYFRVDETLITRIESLQTKEVTDAALDEKSDVLNEDGTVEADENVNPKENTDSGTLESKNTDTRIVFTGDVELSEYVQRNYDANGIDGVVSKELLEQLNSADILEVNNEFCFSTRGTQAPDKQYTFRVNPSYVSVLKDMGVDICGLANNHVLDYGKDALSDTFTTLFDANIEYTGAGTSREDASKLIVKEVNGKKFGFLAASRVIPVGSWNVDNSQPGVFTCYDTTALCNAITEAKNEVDYLFVCVHWGIEHTDDLTDYQIANGHAYIDAGADAVIGAHPHVLQEVEYYNGKPIFYSLGNFMFNETISQTMAVEFTVSEDDEMAVRLLPAYAKKATTYLATEENASSIYNYIDSISKNVTVSDDGSLVFESLVQ